jgi:integrase/recombinase XerD
MTRTGIRLAECAALTIGDLKQEQGHNIVVIRHGKGDKPRIAKIPVDVMREVKAYLRSTGREEVGANEPLFIGFTKNGKPTGKPLKPRMMEYIVEKYGKLIGVDLSPHALRASFVTLALEGGAKLEQVQYAAGHSDPRTTERYQKRKLNLDNNATDYVRLD